MTGGQVRESIEARLRKHMRVSETGCWLWGGHVHKHGYGMISVPGKRAPAKAHRASYEVFVGPIPPGFEIDHLCRVRNCINPAHLEPVTKLENIRRGISPTAINLRKTHCIHGHPFAGSNLRIRPNGNRVCIACKSDGNSRRSRSKENSLRAHAAKETT